MNFKFDFEGSSALLQILRLARNGNGMYLEFASKSTSSCLYSAQVSTENRQCSVNCSLKLTQNVSLIIMYTLMNKAELIYKLNSQAEEASQIIRQNNSFTQKKLIRQSGRKIQFLLHCFLGNCRCSISGKN